jgi:hypothetical protein
MSKRAPRHYTDDNGVLRHVGTGRKVRSDYGTRKPHPRGCAHCAAVDAYLDDLEVLREAAGGWRNEDFRHPIGFIGFYVRYCREVRLARETRSR